MFLACFQKIASRPTTPELIEEVNTPIAEKPKKKKKKLRKRESASSSIYNFRKKIKSKAQLSAGLSESVADNGEVSTDSDTEGANPKLPRKWDSKTELSEKRRDSKERRPIKENQSEDIFRLHGVCLSRFYAPRYLAMKQLGKGQAPVVSMPVQWTYPVPNPSPWK